MLPSSIRTHGKTVFLSSAIQKNILIWESTLPVERACAPYSPQCCGSLLCDWGAFQLLSALEHMVFGVNKLSGFRLSLECCPAIFSSTPTVSSELKRSFHHCSVDKWRSHRQRQVRHCCPALLLQAAVWD